MRSVVGDQWSRSGIAMSLEKLVEDILQKGRERAAEIVREGEAERDEQVAIAQSRMAEDRTKAEKKAEARIALMEQHELSGAELSARKTLLAAQREVLEDLKEQVLSELTHYPSDKKSALYSKLFAKAEAELGDCYVYSSRADEPTLKLPPGMERGGTMECAGGLVFESKDRSVRLDYRFETMLESVWDERMKEIYEQLFG